MSRKIATTIIILQMLAIIPVYWLKLAFYNVSIRDSLYMSTIIMAVIAGFYVTSKYGLKNIRRITFISFTAGVMFSLIAELIFEYYYVVLKKDLPFPSIADFFALSYYVFFLIGLINEIKLAKVNWKKLNKRLLIIPIIISIILISVVSYIGVYKAYDPTLDLFSNIINVAYGVGDLIFIIISLFLFILVKEYQGGRFAKIWLFLMVGVTFSVIGDIFLAYYMDQYNAGIWFYKSFFDTINMLAYLFIALMLYEFAFSISDAYSTINKGLINKDTKPLKITTVSSDTQKED